MGETHVTVGDDRILDINGIEFTVTTAQVEDFKSALEANTMPFWCRIGATEILIGEATQVAVRVHVDGYKLSGGFDLRNTETDAILVL